MLTAADIGDAGIDGNQLVSQVFRGWCGLPDRILEATLTIFAPDGAPLMTLRAPVNAPAGGDGAVERLWETAGVSLGRYTAVAIVTEARADATYEPVQRSIALRTRVFIPAILRGAQRPGGSLDRVSGGTRPAGW
ncbi:MAG: hypothetical protein GX620_10680 [Chloroflexi bacterium]|nr:hypothetical protein [Chloroflexota bacterium]